MGCKYVELDLAEVERLAGLGLTELEIATSLGIHRQTITRRKHQSIEFVEALRRGKAKAHQEVSNALFKLAISGDLGAIIWFEKTRYGLTDRYAIDVRAEKPILSSESHHPLAGFTGRPITDSSRLLESNGAGGWTEVGEDGAGSGDGSDDGSRE